jgi:hypothetical protein
MDFLGYVGQIEARFGPFGGSVNLNTRYGARLHQTYRRLRNQFGCTVCTECAIGSEIILGIPIGTPR